MESGVLFLVAADVLLLGHVLFVAFVVFALVLIFVGKSLDWAWVRNPWFRIVHLAAIGIVVLQSWFGVICPLTTWEMALRELAGEVAYSGSFISHWLETVLYYRAPEWVFTVCYTVFAVIVIASWFWVRPQRLTCRPLALLHRRGNMRHKDYCVVSGVLFSLVALAHLLRLLYSLPVQIGDVAVPMLVSLIGFAVPAALAVWAFRISRGQSAS
jgi:hypothetical protein